MEQTKGNTLKPWAARTTTCCMPAWSPILGRGWTFIDSLTPFTFLFIHSFNIYKSFTLGKAMFPPKSLLGFIVCVMLTFFTDSPEAKTMPEAEERCACFSCCVWSPKIPVIHSQEGLAGTSSSWSTVLKARAVNVQPYRHLIIFWIPRQKQNSIQKPYLVLLWASSS